MSAKFQKFCPGYIENQNKKNRTSVDPYKAADYKLAQLDLCFLRSHAIFVEPACGKVIHSCYIFCSVYVGAFRFTLRPFGFVQAITSIFMHGFQNNLAQLFSLRRRIAV